GGAAGNAHRLPDTAYGQEDRDPVRRADRLFDQPGAEIAGGRRLPAAHPPQDRDTRPHGCGVLSDLPARGRRTQGAIRPAGVYLPAAGVVYQETPAAARRASARPDGADFRYLELRR